MTKKFQHITFAMAMGLCLVACNEDDSIDYTQYYGWRDQNSHLTTELISDVRELGQKAYFTDTIESLAEPYSFYTVYRVLEAANEDSLRKIGRWYTPYATSTLKVHYTLYDTKSVWKRFEEYGVLDSQEKRNDATIMDRIFGIGYGPGMPGYEVKADTLESLQVKFFDSFTSSGVIKGWGDCLQHMHIGDNWLIAIPWYLAYGQAGSSNIDPYTNLFFRIKLVDITKLGDNVEK